MLGSPNESPQFRTAEYAGGDHCNVCKKPVGTSYYRVNGAMTCAACAEKAKSELPKDTHSAFMRALFFGVGAAIVGLILYAAVGIITGLEIGYVSLAVGYIVGKAMKAGSKGLGGDPFDLRCCVARSGAYLDFPVHEAEAAGKPGGGSELVIAAGEWDRGKAGDRTDRTA